MKAKKNKMAEIVHLSTVRDQNAAKAGFKSWQRRFGGIFSIKTRLMDLNHETLIQLAEPGDESTRLINQLIIGFLGFPSDAEFDGLPTWDQSHVLDIYLFLADRIRFEMMARLGWLSQYIGGNCPLFSLVKDYQRYKVLCLQQPPELSVGHPSYGRYKELCDRDRQVFIRRMLSSALEAYKLTFLS